MKTDYAVYGILDPSRCQGRPLDRLAEEAADGGVTVFQLRNKSGSTRDMVKQARAILEVTRPRGIPLLINDRVDVALAAGADGVHVGNDDMAPEDARKLLGDDAILGLTIHSKEEAQADDVGLADYFGVGGVFATASKNNPNPPIGADGLDVIRRVLGRHAAGRPVVGIAGITAQNAASVIEAGADGVAVISDLFMRADVTSAARQLTSAVRGVLGEEMS